ncbi:MAG: sugar-binding domain-containing protein, partial [Christensenellaceae bacterium]
MDQVMELLQRLAPEEVAAMEQRYEILSAISLKGPIGRRALAGAISAQERAVRHQCEVLRAQGLIEAAQEGMRATQAGERVLLSLGPMMRSLTGTGRMAAQLSRLLRVEHVVIQAGAVADDELRKRELCHTAAQYVSRWLPGAHTLAIMGGTTMAQLAQQMPQGNYPELIVLPARGGMGERVEMQANLVAAQMAGRLNAQYRMLHLPDDVNAGTMERLMERASIAEVVAMIRQPDILIYSIGRADELMQRRGLAKQARRMLEAKGAVAEALG